MNMIHSCQLTGHGRLVSSSVLHYSCSLVFCCFMMVLSYAHYACDHDQLEGETTSFGCVQISYLLRSLKHGKNKREKQRQQKKNIPVSYLLETYWKQKKQKNTLHCNCNDILKKKTLIRNMECLLLYVAKCTSARGWKHKKLNRVFLGFFQNGGVYTLFEIFFFFLLEESF